MHVSWSHEQSLAYQDGKQARYEKKLATPPSDPELREAYLQGYRDEAYEQKGWRP